MSKRKNHRREFKANVAPEALKGKRTVAELSRRFGAHPTMINGWKRALLEGARAGIVKWVEFYNHKRPHSAHGAKPTAVVCWSEKDKMQPDQQEQKVA